MKVEKMIARGIKQLKKYKIDHEIIDEVIVSGHPGAEKLDSYMGLIELFDILDFFLYIDDIEKVLAEGVITEEE